MNSKEDERWMFEESFKRPKNYFKLSGAEQWAIDKSLGILDWEGQYLTEEDKKRFKNHYKDSKNYIIRFESESVREAFTQTLTDLNIKYEVGEFLLDLIVYELDTQTLENIQSRAPLAQFFEDVQFQPKA